MAKVEQLSSIGSESSVEQLSSIVQYPSLKLLSICRNNWGQLFYIDALWRLLKTIAIRKANDTRKRLRAVKRGGNQAIYGQSDLAQDDQRLTGVDAAAATVDSPSLDAEVSDLFNSLLSKLPDDRHRDVILLKLQGAPVATIAEHLETSTRTVHRLLKQIEEDWQGELSK